MGLVLEWVYGTIVSTAEKARDGAKRHLGAPTTASCEFVFSAGWSARPLHEKALWEALESHVPFKRLKPVCQAPLLAAALQWEWDSEDCLRKRLCHCKSSDVTIDWQIPFEP